MSGQGERRSLALVDCRADVARIERGCIVRVDLTEPSIVASRFADGAIDDVEVYEHVFSPKVLV
jgi:hypothetical protein